MRCRVAHGDIVYINILTSARGINHSLVVKSDGHEWLFIFCVCAVQECLHLKDYKVLVVKKRNNADKIKLSGTKLASDREY